jgi:hypothetical protein
MMQNRNIIIGLVAICLFSSSILLVSASEEDNEPITIDEESGTFESFSTIGGSSGEPDGDDGATIVGDGYKLTQFTCEGEKCEKMSKVDKRSSPGSSSKPKRASNQIPFDTVRRIIHTNHNNDLYPTLIAEAKPTVVQGSPLINQWSAFNDWNFEYFANLWTPHYGIAPILVSNSTVRGMDSSIFVYNNSTKESSWPGVPKPYYETAMNLGTFFSGQCTKESKETWWWTKPFITLKDEQVIADTLPHDFFIDKTVLNKTTPLLSLVTGSQGATMQLHYDMDDTFIVQVHRRQQILLFSPEQMQKMYLYPWIHPHRRRSQVTPLVDATEARFEGIGSIRGIEAMLEPKDVLFIPRYWGYHVINYDPGISVHVISPRIAARGESTYNFKSHLVTFSHLSPMKRLTAAKYAIIRILEPMLYELNNERPNLDSHVDEEGIITSPPEPVYDRKVLRKFLKDHAHQRYSKLPNYLPPGTPNRKELNQIVKIQCREARQPEHKIEPRDLINLSMRLDNTAEAWREIKEPHIRMSMLHDWVDFIAWQATDDHNTVVSFITKCI